MNEPLGLAPNPGPDGRRRILIVDDHPIVRHGIAQLLAREADLRCDLTADDAPQALSLLREHEVALVIADISLPGLSGLDLCRRIVAAYPELPVLVLSMHEESVYADRALAAGARGFITKQEATDRLVGAVRKVLGGGIWLSTGMEERLVRQRVGAAQHSPTASSRCCRCWRRASARPRWASASTARSRASRPTARRCAPSWARAPPAT
jgi:two-component system, NarL family, response regulator NreC